MFRMSHFVALGCVICCTSVGLAQRGMGDLRGMAARAERPEVTSVVGELREIRTHSCEQTTGPSPLGTHLIVVNEQGEQFNLHLGPAGEVDDVLAAVRTGDRLTIRGFRTERMPANHLSVVSLKAGSEQINLRNEQLRPRWSGGGKATVRQAAVEQPPGKGCGVQQPAGKRHGPAATKGCCASPGQARGKQGGGGCGSKGQAAPRGRGVCGVPGELPAGGVATADLAAALRAAVIDEYHAAHYYAEVMKIHGEQRPFSQLRGAELRHAAALVRHFERYGLTAPLAKDVSAGAVPPSWNAAVSQAIQNETDNVAMYDRLLAKVDDVAVRATFEHLRVASQDCHLPALRRAQSGMHGRGRVRP